MRSYYENESPMLCKVYPIEKMYTPEGPKFDKEIVEFYLLIDSKGEGANWQMMLDKQLLPIPFVQTVNLDWELLRETPNLVLSDFLWTCNCAKGRFIHHTDLCLCMDCKTIHHSMWDKINDHGRETLYKSVDLFPNLHTKWGYERQKFEMTDEQLVALTFGTFELLEPCPDNNYAYC